MRIGVALSVLAAASCMGFPLSDEMACADYEARVRAVGSLPPVLKTVGLENYSSNRLTYVLMNALEMTRGGRIWLNWISGGDGAESFTAGCWSDDGGKTFTDVNFVTERTAGYGIDIDFGKRRSRLAAGAPDIGAEESAPGMLLLVW